MKNKHKVALFDFCETLVSFQTADTFVFYICGNYGNIWTKTWGYVYDFLKKIGLVSILSKLFPKKSINKRLVLYHLKGYNKDEIETYANIYYEQIVKPRLIKPVIDRLKDFQDKGYTVFIVSAGYEIYLKYFAREYGIPLDNIIAVKILFKNNKCKGIFDGGDRLWDKTEKLDIIFARGDIYSVAFSDSPSDIPLLEWANEGYVIRHHDKVKWDTKNLYKEIIW